MTYYFACKLDGDFGDVVERVKVALGKEGFGVLTEVDVAATMKKKLDRDMPAYRILGACHPASAWRALEAENKIGTMLPCNVIVRDDGGKVEVAAVDPVASMAAVQNESLGVVATEVRAALQRVVASLSSSAYGDR